jgi:hypothetical protein
MAGGGGGGGGGADPPAPSISGLGPGPSIQGPPLPVGAYASFTVMAPGGWTIDPATIQWSGGTNYKSYFTDAATTTVKQDPSLQAVSLVQGVTTNNGVYSFIVGAQAQQYTITVNCSYVNPNGGADIAAPQTTLTFNSVRPTTATIQGMGGFQSFWTTTSQATLAYTDNNQPWTNGKGHGNVIEANTQTGQFGGNFMFLQIDTVDMSWSDGSTTYTKSTFGNEYLDDGVNGACNPIGSEIEHPIENGWSLGPSSVLTSMSTFDAPSLAEPLDAESMSVMVTLDTYLMYMPTGGVWVALADLQWSWVGSAENIPPWPGNSATSDDGGTSSTPSGAAAFPGWSGDTSELTWEPSN